jgi:hypothetical protein
MRNVSQEEDEQSVRTLSHRAESIPVDQLVELLALNRGDLELERRGIAGSVASSFLGYYDQTLVVGICMEGTHSICSGSEGGASVHYFGMFTPEGIRVLIALERHEARRV